MIIPIERLSQAVLQNIMEDFITREGTDYGQIELSLAEKVQGLRRQLSMGEAVLTFDERTQSISVMTALQYQQQESLYDKPM